MDTQIMYSNLTWSPSGDQLGYTLCDEYQCSIRRVDKNGNKVFDVVYLDPGVSSVYWTYTPLKIHPQVMSTPATP